MKAAILEEIGKLNICQVDEPKCGAGRALVRVRRAGICGSDVPRIYKTGAHKMPLICGHEFAGEVLDCGANVSDEWRGKAVGIFPLIPCGACPSCAKKQYEMCDNYSYLGSRCDGGFAELVAVPEWNLLQLPAGVSFEDAAMLEPTAVAAHAMRRVEPLADDVVAVCGLGTIGLLMVMLLKEAGVKRVIAIGNKESQRAMAVELGVNEADYIDASCAGYESAIGAVDVFFECVGKNETINLAISKVNKGGKVMLVGNPASDMEFPKGLYWEILRKQLSVYGTWNSSYTGEEDDDWHYALGKIAEGKIEPSKLISHRFSLDEIEKGLEIMRDKTEDYIKIMIEQ